jgi:hypothetical protein
MLDFQMFAQELKMHAPIPAACEVEPDPLWVEQQETYLFPIFTSSALGVRYIAGRIAQTGKTLLEECWVIWSRAPRLWSDENSALSGDPTDEFNLLARWAVFVNKRRGMIRTQTQIEELWPRWLAGEKWFAGKPDPTCLT